jgi:hypothetical protein
MRPCDACILYYITPPTGTNLIFNLGLDVDPFNSTIFLSYRQVCGHERPGDLDAVLVHRPKPVISK